MDIHDIALIDSDEVAVDARAFRFPKPAGFAFVPDQFANQGLIDDAMRVEDFAGY